MDKQKSDSKLDKIYYNPADPVSYGGLLRLYRRAKEVGIKNINTKSVKEYLSRQPTYSLQKPAIKRFKRNPTVVGKIDKQWHADLADMQGLANENDDYRYLLTVIEIFIKFEWVVRVKIKMQSLRSKPSPISSKLQSLGNLKESKLMQERNF